MENIKDFRPIDVANFRFKIISKILADRLAHITSKIVSPNQNGFIKGRQIKDCLCVTSKAINLLPKIVIGGDVAVKIDISKAFDTLNWHFLLQVLERFGFHRTFSLRILEILKSDFLSLRVNGISAGYFSYGTGVRHGDPLSPYSFLLGERGAYKRFNIASSGEKDFGGLCRGNARSLRAWGNFLNLYCSTYGEVIF